MREWRWVASAGRLLCVRGHRGLLVGHHMWFQLIMDILLIPPMDHAFLDSLKPLDYLLVALYVVSLELWIAWMILKASYLCLECQVFVEEVQDSVMVMFQDYVFLEVAYHSCLVQTNPLA